MLPAGVRRLFRLPQSAKRVAREVDDELRFHLDEKTDALVRAGWEPAAARAEAERLLGDVGAVRRDLAAVARVEVVRRQRRDWLGDWWLDVRHAARGLVRTPAFSLAVVTMLAVGIGATAAMFDLLDRLLLRAPPGLVQPQTLVRVVVTSHKAGRPDYTTVVGSYADVADYSRGVPAFRAVAGYAMPRPVALGDSSGRAILRSSVTARYFDVLGTRPFVGRVLDSSDVSGAPVAVISYRLWRGYFLGAPSALGSTLDLGGVRFTIVGIMPSGFSGAEADAADVWTLADQDRSAAGPDWRTARHTLWLLVIARLESGRAGAAAIAQVAAVRRANGSVFRGTSETVTLGSIIPGRLSPFDAASVRLSVAVAVVSALLLLIAIANTANLLLVRAVSRVREFAVRVALGAGRARLLRALLIESGLLAVASGIAAAGVTVVAGWGLRTLLLPNYAWTSPPLGLASGAFAAGCALVTALVAGLVPGVMAGREEVLGWLRAGVQRGRGGQGGVRAALVAIQTAIAMLLLATAGLFVRSFARAGNEDHGVAVRQLVYAAVPLTGDQAARADRLEQVRAALRRLPGVSGATAISNAPMQSLSFATLRVPEADTSVFAMRHDVSPDFLTVAGLRLIRGRGLSPDDGPGAEQVALVDSVFAARVWTGEEALGRCFSIDMAAGCRRVVGVVAHIRSTGLTDTPMPQFFLPLAQSGLGESCDLLIRAANPDMSEEAIWRAIAVLVPGYHRAAVESYNRLLAPQLAPWRVAVMLSALAAALAIALSTIGAYAVMAFTVRQRRHELGVRRALGAGTAHVLGIVVGRGAAVAGAGVLAGAAAFVALGGVVAPLLYRMPARDPLVGVGAAAVLMLASVGAALTAGALAVRVPPTEALRAD